MSDRTTPSGAPTPVLITDSSCDLTPEMLEELGVVSLAFPVIVDGVEFFGDSNPALTTSEFYDHMREGAVTKTAAIPRHVLVDAFSRFAGEGRPVIYLGLSSALSGTFEGVRWARDTVVDQHPDAVISVIDSLNASTALGLLIHETATRINAGASHDDVVAWLQDARTALSANFTVDSLEYLARGGRINPALAAAGTMLDIKPRLRIDREGRLVVGEKLRGRRRSLRALADLVARDIELGAGSTIAIGHGDSADDAEVLRSLIAERIDVGEVLDLEVGPVIGSHTGPGMVSVVFWSAQRPS